MDHIIFDKATISDNDRRKRKGIGTPIPDKDFHNHGSSLTRQVKEEVKNTLNVAKKFQFSPYLIVKIELEKDTKLTLIQQEKLELLGLRVIDNENQEVMVVFSDNCELENFFQALDNYKNGKIAKTKVENQDLFNIIKSVSRWSSNDRKELNIQELNDIDYIDCYLWIFDYLDDTKNKAEEFIKKTKEYAIKVCDKYISQSVAIVRLKIEKSKMNYFLENPLVYKVEKIPDYKIKSIEKQNEKETTLSDIKYNNKYLNESNSSICVIDSGILSSHPLIKECMGDGKTFYTTNHYIDGENDIDGHGTMVAGICEYGNINIYQPFLPHITLFNAKIHNGEYIGNLELCKNELENEKFELSYEQNELLYEYFTNKISLIDLKNKFPMIRRMNEMYNIISKYIDIYEKLIPTQMREIVEYFYSQYGCRIYNLSQGDLFSSFNDGKPRAWTCVLDELQNEYDVIFVVSSGNYVPPKNTMTPEEIKNEYPYYFFKNISARIIDPANSVTSVTVGGISNSDIPYQTQIEQIDNLPISKKNQISSITCIGPGYKKSIKPDFVAYSGDKVFRTLNKLLSHNRGFKVLSLSNDLIKNGLFTRDYGTSFSTPYVSHIIALIQEKYPTASNNLIRAILASSSIISQELREQIDNIYNYYEKNSLLLDKSFAVNKNGTTSVNKEKLLHYMAGYGYPNEDLAVNSFNNHIVLIADMKAEKAILPDKFNVFEIPIPKEFIETKGKKRIIISLAFNPQVRKTRLDYMGCEMSFNLIRGYNLEEVCRVYKSQKGESTPLPPFEQKYICTMKESKKSLRSSSTLQKGVFEFSKSDYGDSYCLVVNCEKKWSDCPQNYAIAVTYEIEENSSNLYNIIKNKVQIRNRTKV